MDQPLNYLQRAGDHWLVGYNAHKFTDLAGQLFQKLTQIEPRLPRILLTQRDPVQFLASFIAASAAGCPVFLANPDWARHEWQQVFDLAQPELVWEDNKYPLDPCLSEQNEAHKGWIMVPTGGSSGQMRFVIHTWATLMASVEGFQEYFQLSQINSLCVLPLYHVSGLLQFIRCFTSGGRLLILPFKTLASGAGQNIDPTEFFLSLVPTQLQRLLTEATWLCRWQTVLLGGAPAWPQLLADARHHQIRLAPTYGMTETAAQIATLKPEAFLSGNSSCGQVLPHAKVTICTPTGKVLGPDQTGRVTIQANSLALGYYPLVWQHRSFPADDLGYVDAQGDLNIVGRLSHKIITGGENVFPAEVESAIRATNLVTDVCVIGLPDQDWGEILIAVYVPHQPKLALPILQAALKPKLSKFKQPKHWISLPSLPRNSQGKINREQLQQTASEWLRQDLGSQVPS